MKALSLILATLLILLQYQLWLSNGGVREVWRLDEELARYKTQIQHLRDRNRALAAEVIDLKGGLDAVEERARSDLGMIRKNETFYQVIETRPDMANARR